MVIKAKGNARGLEILWNPYEVQFQNWLSISNTLTGQIHYISTKEYVYLTTVYPLDFIFGKDVVIKTHSDIDTEIKFIEQIQLVHQKVQEQIEKNQGKYKARHDKHRQDHKFEVGDKFWLHINKERLQGEGKKIKPIRYGLFRILEKIGNDAFRLDLPSYMQIYDVVNVVNIRLYEPPLIEDQGENIQIPSIAYFSPEFLDDTILDRRTRTSKRESIDYLQVGFKATNPLKDKWIEVGKVRQLYPQLLDN